MHAGGIITIHFFWLASLVVILLLLAIGSGLAAFLTRGSGSPPPAS
jgi:hypothetical protein